MPPNRRGGLGLWLLLYQVFGNIGFHRIPPATLVITALQCLLFIRVIKVPWFSVRDVCISVDKVWAQGEYRRLFIGAFEHMDDFHLYYNMISFIWKGITLERMFGSGKFFYIVSVFSLLCNITLIALCKLASEYLEGYYYYQCAVGFSGVVFALKVLTTHYWPEGGGRLMGLPIDIPARYIVWAELLLIQVLVPNASFVGHLAGILVGLAYIHTPVKSIVDGVWSVLASILFSTPNIPYLGTGYNGSHQRNYFSPASGSPLHTRNNNHEGNLPYPPTARNRNFPQPDFVPESEEEQLQRALDESIREQYPPYAHSNLQNSPPYAHSNQQHSSPYGHSNQQPSAPYPEESNRLYPDLDELRRRRVENYYS